MSSVFRSPKKPDIPVAEEVETVANVEEGAEVAARKSKKKILKGGRRGTIISGIAKTLKERLGK